MQVTRMTVQNQTFAEYALFISEWNNDFIFTMEPNGIQGPVHTNGFLRLAAPGADYWTATKSNGTPQDPWVNGPLARITHSGSFLGTSTDPVNTLGITADGVQYANGNSYSSNLGLVPYTDTGSPIAERYNKIVSGGRDNIRQVSRVEMPAENGKLREDAWGTTLPANTTQWNNAARGETVLVNTDTGKANDPSGKVAGGIFVRGSDPSDVLLDLTPEGHQKIRIRQGNTSVAGATTTTYYADVPQYHKPIHYPAWVEQTTTCVRTATRTVDVWENVRKTRTVTQANAAECGTHQEFVPGENGISQPITVPNVCTYTETYYVSEKTGTRQETYCAQTGPGTPINHPARTEWVTTTASDPDRQPNGSRREVVEEGYPGAEAVTVQGTRSIQKWSSVVEVNDSDYKIPYYPGVKVNGETASGPTDPILTVSDGHTVAIKNDYQDGNGDYAEYTVMEGRTNGIVYSDVNLWGVRGTNKGAKTFDEAGNLGYQGRVIATNIKESKKVEIRDSILQYYDGNGVDEEGNPLNDGKNRLVPGATSPSPDHILGLIGTNIDIKPSGKSHTYENTDTARRENGNVGNRPFRGGDFKGGLNVYAIFMAGRTKTNGDIEGGFGSHNNAMDGDDNLGDFNLYGGVISGVARKTQNYSGGDNNGFRLHLNYDPIAAAFMRFFPPVPQFRPLRYVTFSPGGLQLHEMN